MTSNQDKAVATLAGGCFWCLEAVYKQLVGVEQVVSGYTGGDTPDPTYEQVCSGTTGHAEAVQITYNPHQISYREIIEVFFSIHDPTTLNRQGNDIGTQYRSAIFTHDQEQHEQAERAIAELEAARIWTSSIVTEVVPLEEFFPAEDYHQDYYERNPNKPYCQMVISPKLAAFRKKFRDKLKI
ncbi:MAG: peptide-methionine (S)-S-oxide reductase MsrA [Anaerolineales bacterium]|nr:peptide-methionine (S)-S-oxide reductase MsrA [Anaerolineales bacterium]